MKKMNAEGRKGLLSTVQVLLKVVGPRAEAAAGKASKMQDEGFNFEKMEEIRKQVKAFEDANGYKSLNPFGPMLRSEILMLVNSNLLLNDAAIAAVNNAMAMGQELSLLNSLKTCELQDYVEKLEARIAALELKLNN